MCGLVSIVRRSLLKYPRNSHLVGFATNKAGKAYPIHSAMGKRRGIRVSSVAGLDSSLKVKGQPYVSDRVGKNINTGNAKDSDGGKQNMQTTYIVTQKSPAGEEIKMEYGTEAEAKNAIKRFQTAEAEENKFFSNRPRSTFSVTSKTFTDPEGAAEPEIPYKQYIPPERETGAERRDRERELERQRQIAMGNRIK